MTMLEFRYDTQLLIEGENLDEDTITDYFTENFRGDCDLRQGQLRRGGQEVLRHPDALAVQIFGDGAPAVALEYGNR